MSSSSASAPPAGSPLEEGHPRRWAILGVLVISLLIVVLDNTVLNVALPTIQQELQATQSQLLWSIDSYVLVFAALLFTWGVLGDRYGRRRILMIGLSIFAVGSALSAVATSAEQLIGFRALMGIGGAAVIPVTLAIITVVFPPAERGRAIGAWAGAVGAAVALGPVLAGVLLEHPQWFEWATGNDFGSIFMINLPIVAVGMLGTMRLVPESRNPNPGRLDPLGLLLSITGLTLVVYGIIHAGDTKDWLAPAVLAPLLGGLAVLALFVFLEMRSAHSSFDVALFRDRGFTVSLLAMSLAFFAMNAVVFEFPFYLQVVRGFSTLQTGLCFVPFAVGQLLAAPVSSVLVARWGNRFVIGAGLSILSATLIGLSFVKIDTPIWIILATFVFFGYGMGNVMAPASTLIQNTIPRERAGAGSAVQNTVRQVFGALGVALAGTVLATRYSHYLKPTLDALPPQVPQAARSALDTSVAAVPQVTEQAAAAGFPAPEVDALRDAAFQAFVSAGSDASLLAIGVALAATVLVVFGLPAAIAPKASPAPNAAGRETAT